MDIYGGPVVAGTLENICKQVSYFGKPSPNSPNCWPIFGIQCAPSRERAINANVMVIAPPIRVAT